ncbi:MAG: DEAD/DEAH box helicase family protein [Chloroflexota bacterium]|nr:DEAD/DEAH box helicase family protein [Chloroflexota bacterium]MDE2884950.1 DEAD/DEAH box helicase family protein [Chloroflexota bacterium]
MVDFDRLRRARSNAKVVHPKDIFLRLPKPEGIDDLWQSQAEALDEWFGRRDQRDLVLKLNTGGGKTLVGLLMAQSTLAENGGPVLFLCATNQLVQQTVSHATPFGIRVVPYIAGQDLDGDFLSGKAIMVASYQALFNGLSKFGVAGGRRDIVHPTAIILDDAHTAFSVVRDQFSIAIGREQLPDTYRELTQCFRHAFEEIGKQGTFDDITEARDEGVIEVPYWSWSTSHQEIRQQLASLQAKHFPWQWPLLRDHFDRCHAFVSRRDFAITLLYPNVDMFPSFAECPRRIYMSATVADDSSIVRTFGADPSSVSSPIAPLSLAGVGERMILVPNLMGIDRAEVEPALRRLVTWAAGKAGTVILVPSTRQAQAWEEIAETVDGDSVADAIDDLVRRSKNGPIVMANRYDGIDLPGDSCRLLVLNGLPAGSNSYDLYRATVLEGSATINTTIAQRIEQGMGRGTRGAGDHCVVVLADNALAKWISNHANRSLLTSPTRVQLELGISISEEIYSLDQLGKTVLQSFNRDQAWVEYQAQVLAEETSSPSINKTNLLVAGQERRFFRLLLDGYFDKAIDTHGAFIEDTPAVDGKVKGWLCQQSARAAWLWGHHEKSDELQRQAYHSNKMLLRPRVGFHHTPMTSPTVQSQQILNQLSAYSPRRGLLAEFEEWVDWLTPKSSSNQFEESLKNLGRLLGYSTSRPDDEDNIGPDVLWLLSSTEALVIEAKSRKMDRRPANKSDHGQLLEAMKWFSVHYPAHTAQGVIVNSVPLVTNNVTPGDTFALTFNNLDLLIQRARSLFRDVTATSVSDDSLLAQIEKSLVQLGLNPKGILTYLEPLRKQ